jgi:hypothetical protein
MRVTARWAGRQSCDEGADTLGASRFAGTGEDDVEARNAAVGDPGLLAVEDKGVAIAGGGELDGGDVGAGARLAEGEG